MTLIEEEEEEEAGKRQQKKNSGHTKYGAIVQCPFT